MRNYFCRDQLAFASHRTIKADVLVNCARIGFKP
jgi:hypothetical protein